MKVPWDRFVLDGAIYYHVIVGDTRYRIQGTRRHRRWLLYQQPKEASVWGSRRGIQFIPPPWEPMAEAPSFREIRKIATEKLKSA